MREGQKLAKEYGLSQKVELHQEGAGNLSFKDKFKLLTNHGLNIYEPDNEKVTKLYQQFFQALMPEGILVTSFAKFCAFRRQIDCVVPLRRTLLNSKF